MLAFITSVRHPHNSNSYEKVLALLTDTLRSVSRQTVPHFRILVVYNELAPDFSIEPAIGEHVDFLQVDFPPPSPVKSAATSMAAIRKDRGTKYVVGVLAASHYQPTHVMFFDADDFVGRDLAEFTHQRPDEHGWVMNRGLWYKDGKVKIHRPFFMRCGTSSIVRYGLLRELIPSGLDPRSSQPEILAAMDPWILGFIFGSHRFAPQYFSDRGAPLRPYPSIGAVRNLATGENHSDIIAVNPPSLVPTTGERWRPVTEADKISFGLP